MRAASRKVRRSHTTWALALCRSLLSCEIACSSLRSVTRQWARTGPQKASVPATTLRTGRAFMANSRGVIPTIAAGYSGDHRQAGLAFATDRGKSLGLVSAFLTAKRLLRPLVQV